MIAGLAIATVIGRLLWPTLPQTLLRDDLVTLFKDNKSLLSRDPGQERIQTRLAILSVEALQAIRQIRGPRFSKEERNRVTALVYILQALSARLRHLLSHRHLLPEVTEEFLGPPFERIEFEFSQMLDAFLETFRTADFRPQFPGLPAPLSQIAQTLNP